ncbi:hypothetical protein ACFLUF_01160 [Chloroflexota bacterium]
MGLKVFSTGEFIISHILLVGGLVLVTVGLLQGLTSLGAALIIAGMWVGALGPCIGFGAAFKKLIAK